MTTDDLQAECERGQTLLMEMQYFEAEKTLANAESHAWAARDWDSLSRLYMPLQEARRQRRQRAGEGIACLDLLAGGPDDRIDPLHVVKNYSHGQLLVAGWGSVEPALKVRQLADEHHLYLDTFLAATFPTDAGLMVAIIPLPEAKLPDPVICSPAELDALLPPGSIRLPASQLPQGSRRGTYKTYAEVMALWERLHSPFLAAADAQGDPVIKLQMYRTSIQIDYACELAHQKFSDVARRMLR